MSVSIRKGGSVSLSKAASTPLRKVTVGLGWDERITDGADFDLDAVVFICGQNGRVRGDADFIFYNNLASPDGSVEHQGDELVGGSDDGDDESIVIDLPQIHRSVQKIAICVTIHEADIRGQNFGMVRNAYVRVVDNNNDKEITRYDLSEYMSSETAVVFAELFRQHGDWKFRAVGQGILGGLRELAVSYGVNVE